MLQTCFRRTISALEQTFEVPSIHHIFFSVCPFWEKTRVPNVLNLFCLVLWPNLLRGVVITWSIVERCRKMGSKENRSTCWCPEEKLKPLISPGCQRTHSLGLHSPWSPPLSCCRFLFFLLLFFPFFLKTCPQLPRERLNNLLVADKDKIFPQAIIQPDCHLCSAFPHLTYSFQSMNGPAALCALPYHISERYVTVLSSILWIQYKGGFNQLVEHIIFIIRVFISLVHRQ